MIIWFLSILKNEYDWQARQQIIINLLNTENNDLTPTQILEVAQLTDGYSGADMKSLCSEAAMGPIRAVPLDQIVTINMNKVPTSMIIIINLYKIRIYEWGFTILLIESCIFIAEKES